MQNANMRRFFDRLDTEGLKVTFDDVRLQTHYSDIKPGETDVSGQFSKRIKLKIPIVSSPMDTVTTGDMAIQMALMGGLGIIHRNLSPQVQAKEVGRVKNRLHGKVFTPITVSGDQTIASVLEMCARKKYEFRTFPVLDGDGVMLGLLTRTDFDFCEDPDALVRDVMTPFDILLTAQGETNRRQALARMKEHKKKVLPLIDDGQRLMGLFVFSDLKRILSKNAEQNLDSEGRLVVGAAIGVGDNALHRAELLAEKGCDVFQIDTAHGNSKAVIETVRKLKEIYPSIDVVAGNVSNATGALSVADAGADGVLVGQGPGSICTTRIIAGIGAPQVSAVYECAYAFGVRGIKVPLCADGGIRSSGDSVISFAVGASSVMLGRILAGTDEAPGAVETVRGKRVKVYRGMGSLGAMRENASSRERYGQSNDVSKSVPEGVESVVEYRGPVSDILTQHIGGIRSGLGYHGTRTFAELANVARIFRMSGAGVTESHPHDVELMVAPPNYTGR